VSGISYEKNDLKLILTVKEAISRILNRVSFDLLS